MRTFRRHFDVVFGCFAFGLVSHAFQLGLFGLFRLFFIGGGWVVCILLRGVLLNDLAGLPLTVIGAGVLAVFRYGMSGNLQFPARERFVPLNRTRRHAGGWGCRFYMGAIPGGMGSLL